MGEICGVGPRAAALSGLTKGSDLSRAFKQKMELHDEMQPLKETSSLKNHNSQNIKEVEVAKSKINERAKALGLTYYDGGIDEELALIDKVELVLPKRSVIWRLVDRYFSHIYVFLPFLDEEDFRRNIANHIGPESAADERVVLKVDKKMDFIYLGLLLVVIRLSYLSLFTNSATVNQANLRSNDPSPLAQNMKFLLNHAISIDTIDVAEMCLKQFNLFQTLNFPLIQLALYLRLYKIYAPEEGEAIDCAETRAGTCTIIQMAYSMGLNRDMEQYPGQDHDSERIAHLKRKVWYYLVMTDIYEALYHGIPSAINPVSYDTKEPVYKAGLSNTRNPELEEIALGGFSHIIETTRSVTKLINIVVNVLQRPNVHELCSIVSDFETRNSPFYQDLDFIRNPVYKEYYVDSEVPRDVVDKVRRLKYYFGYSTMLCNLYFHLFNHFEAKQEVEIAFFYLKKMIFMLIHDMMPVYDNITKKGPHFFHKSTDLIISPSLEAVLHKGLIVVCLIWVRTKFSLEVIPQQTDHFNRLSNDTDYAYRFHGLEELAQLLNACFTRLHEYLLGMSERYFVAWRVAKVSQFLKEVIDSGDVYTCYENSKSTLPFNGDMVSELVDIFSLSLDLKRDDTESSSTYSGYSGSISTISNEMKPTGFTPKPFEMVTPINFNQFDPQQPPDVDNMWMQMLAAKQDSEFDFRPSNDFTEFNLNFQGMDGSPMNIFNDMADISQFM